MNPLPPIPADFGIATSYVQHFRDFADGGEPVMAYFCGLYACQLAISDPECKRRHQDFLIHLLDALDTLKEKVKDHPALANDQASLAYVIQQASRLFISADDEETAGMSSLSTAQAFATSAHFLQTGKLFRKELPMELEERCKYARLKAIEIRKRLASKITTTEFNGNSTIPEKPDVMRSTPTDNRTDSTPNKIGKSPDYPTISTTGPNGRLDHKPVATIPKENTSTSTTESKTTVGTGSILPSFLGTMHSNYGRLNSNIAKNTNTTTSPTNNSYNNANIISNLEKLTKAEKHARQAISALQFEDMGTAKDHLRKALEELDG